MGQQGGSGATAENHFLIANQIVHATYEDMMMNREDA